MERTQASFTVIVTLDPLPGAFHTKENAADIIAQILKDRIGHYNPVVIEQD